MNYVAINGIPFDVTVAIAESGIVESANVLDGPNAGRVMTGRMVRDIIGTYIGHKVTFFNAASPSNGKTTEAFDALWDYLIAHSVDDSVMLEAVDGQSSINYEVYYTNLQRTLKSVSGGVKYWDTIEVNFIAMDARVRP